MSPSTARVGRRLFQVLVAGGLVLGLGLHGYAAYMQTVFAKGTEPTIHIKPCPDSERGDGTVEDSADQPAESPNTEPGHIAFV